MPVSDGAFDAALSNAVSRIFAGKPPPRIGIAVSGGGDSMALLHLAHLAFPGRIDVATVDHGLRAASAEEAAGVARFCATLDIGHSTLRWHGPTPTGNLMDQARRARLHLLADWALERGIGHIMLGHTADDQAESFLMNLGRAAGLDGLSGMRPTWVEQGIQWHRPLLAIPRETLRTYLRQHNVGWIDDPSNDNDRFTRVKARQAMRALVPLGITVDRLAETIDHLSRAQQALRQAVVDAVAVTVTEQAGALHVLRPMFCKLMPDIRRRILMAVISWFSGSAYPPRQPQLFRLEQALQDIHDATLGGVRFRHRNDHILVTREPRAVQGAVTYGQVWDHRWQIIGPPLPGAEIAALGAVGLQDCPDWRAYAPREALLTSPALWQQGRLIAAPLAGKAQEYRAELSTSLNQFILSH